MIARGKVLVEEKLGLQHELEVLKTELQIVQKKLHSAQVITPSIPGIYQG